MKVVVNSCFGGFSISSKAVKRLAELNSRKCYFFRQDGYNTPYIPVTEDYNGMAWAFDAPNPNNFRESDKFWDDHYLTDRPEDRSDPKLVQVVEELGKEADGSYARLRVVEIPDDVKWEINDYDGQESVHEVHRSW